jgi:hypothetical protein
MNVAGSIRRRRPEKLAMDGTRNASGAIPRTTSPSEFINTHLVDCGPSWIGLEDADYLNNLGNLLWQQGRLANAEAHYRRALQLRPGDYAVLSNLGNALWSQGQNEDAADCYRRALAIRDDSVETWINLGVVLSDQGQLDESQACLEHAIGLSPQFPDAHQNLGMTLARQGRLDEAMARYEYAIALRPEYPEAHRNRALVWLVRGDFARGWSEYEWRLRCASGRLPAFSQPRWQGENFAGRTLLLHAEQGLGDTLQFVRFAAVAKRRGGSIVLACAPALVELLKRCPGVDNAVSIGSSPPEFDFYAPLMSVPAILGTSVSTLPAEIPYLAADAERVARWHQALEQLRGFRVGIVWQGNSRTAYDRRRSFPLAHFAPLAALPNVRLISIQTGDGVDQLHTLGGRFPVEELSRNGVAGPGDFQETAAVMTQLDLIITADTATAHLAGGLGKRVWIALPFVPDWRWQLDRDDSPWYANVRLFRQSVPGDWDGVFLRMANALKHEIEHL